MKDGDAGNETTDVIDLPEFATALAGSEDPYAATQSWRRAPKACEAIWERYGDGSSPPDLWLLPLAQPGDSPSGILIAAKPSVINAWRAPDSPCAALASTIALSLRNAIKQQDALRLNDELLSLHRKLSQAQAESARTRSIAMIAQMAAGAAHELNNPLAVIAGRAQMQLTKHPDPEVTRPLEIIVEQANKAAQIVLELMRFAAPQQPCPALLNLNDVLEAASQHWQRESKLSDDQIQVHVAGAAELVFADPTQLEEILHAVVSNAIAACAENSPRVQINSPQPTSDDNIRIVVSDNGIGMTRTVLEHAVDPFFSSRPAGRGRGLGLSHAVRLAEINGGRLWIESTEGTGTTVTIELPRTARH
jgi:signal transduction histidine kinase